MKEGLPGALRNTNMLGIPAGARKFRLSKHLARWFPESFPGSTDGQCWACVNGMQMGSIFSYCQRVSTPIFVCCFILCWSASSIPRLSLLRELLLSLLCQTRCSVWVVEVTVVGGIKAFSLSEMCKHFCYFSSLCSGVRCPTQLPPRHSPVCCGASPVSRPGLAVHFCTARQLRPWSEWRARRPFRHICLAAIEPTAASTAELT